MKKVVYLTFAACVSFYAGQASAKSVVGSESLNGSSIAREIAETGGGEASCDKQQSFGRHDVCTSDAKTCRARAEMKAKTAKAALGGSNGQSQ